GVGAKFFLVSAQIAAVPRYVLSVEWPIGTPSAELTARAAALFEAELLAMNIEYRAKRESERLGAMIGRDVETGRFERAFEEGSTRGANAFKLPNLSSQPLHERLRGTDIG